MKIFTVHVRPDLPQAAEQAEFVREGFNFYAFLFTGLWTLYQRLWWLTVAILAFNMLVVALGKAYLLSSEGATILQLGFQVYVGYAANDWLRRRLEKRGYVTADVTASDSQLGAEQRYFERHLAAHLS